MHNSPRGQRPHAPRPGAVVRQIGLLVLLATLAACVGGGGGQGEQQIADDTPIETPSRPNLLIIMADDLGYNDLGSSGGNNLGDTPKLDAFAGQSQRFSRHYAYAVCSPARVALLTGRYPERVGFLPSGRGISAEFETLAARLQGAGYTTSHIGKWHSGSADRSAWPDRQGFDRWFGFLNQWRLAGAVGDDGAIVAANPRYLDPWLEGTTEPGAFYPGHLEIILRDRALEEISRLQDAGGPWFLNLWLYAPHKPLQPAEEFAAAYPDSDAGRYRAVLRQLDDTVGRVLEQLRDAGAADNTIVVFVSDNGSVDEWGLDSNAPFFGIKRQLLEGGLRTPLLIRWPDPELNNSNYSGVVSLLDLYPTLLAALDIAAPADLDGHNLLPALRGVAPAPARALFWEASKGQYSVLSADGNWRLQRGFGFKGLIAPVLYDLAADPGGWTLAGADQSGRMQSLQAAFSDWHRDVHVVRTQYQQTDYGAVVSGMDLLRTPGFGQFTFAVPLPPAYAGRIAGQGSLWQLALSGGVVTAQVGDQLLSGVFPRDRACHSVVLTGDFRTTAPGGDVNEMEVALYLDGQLAQTGVYAVDFSLDNVREDTTLGDPLISAPGGRPGRPVVLNVRVREGSEQTPAELDAAVCESGP